MKRKLVKNRITKKINIVIYTKYNLIHNCIGQLLERNDDVNVIVVEFTTSGLLNTLVQTKPDIILLCLVDEVEENIELIPQILKTSPGTRVMILADPNDLSDQAKALRSGAAGIIGMNQNVRVLTKAIRQVYEGDTWLSQKLIRQLIDGGAPSNRGSQGGKIYNSIEDLTKREFEVIEEIAKGLKNKEISQKLFISEATVRHHLSSIYSKLQVGDRLNLVIYAFQNNLIDGQKSSGQTYLS
jgi:two-component system, NarL family, response regulator DegU